ncbi:MAG TPA: acyltransferase [Longimicrobiaceae bacterium]
MLDGLRGVAILMVMLYHQTLIGDGGPFVDQAWSAVLGVGWAGVDLFFVLSGFLITGILFDAKGSGGYFRAFYARRVLRIFPLYYAVVAFSLLVLPNLAHPKAENFARVAGQEHWYWLHLSNVVVASNRDFWHGILDVAWSLSIEEQFYLVWPLAVFALGRTPLMRLCAALVAGALAWRVGALLLGVHPVAVYVLPLSRMDALAVGALVALWARGPAGIAAPLRAARPVALASGAALLGMLVGLRRLDAFQPLVQTAGYTLLALLFGALLTLAVAARPESGWARALDRPALRTLGKYSYAMYLFHFPIRGVLRDAVYGPDRFLVLAGSAIPGQILFYALSTAVTLLAAWLSWHLYEKRFLALKKHFPYGERPAAPGVVGKVAFDRVGA